MKMKKSKNTKRWKYHFNVNFLKVKKTEDCKKKFRNVLLIVSRKETRILATGKTYLRFEIDI